MNWKKLIAVLIVLGLIVAVPGVPGAFAKNPNPGVLPPQSHAFGMTYGEWSAAWWQWAFSLPVDHHPLFDTADCSAGQSGKVWFLGASFAPSVTSGGDVIAFADRQ